MRGLFSVLKRSYLITLFLLTDKFSFRKTKQTCQTKRLSWAALNFCRQFYPIIVCSGVLAKFDGPILCLNNLFSINKQWLKLACTAFKPKQTWISFFFEIGFSHLPNKAFRRKCFFYSKYFNVVFPDHLFIFLIFKTTFPSGYGRRSSSRRKTRNTSRFTATSDCSAGSSTPRREQARSESHTHTTCFWTKFGLLSREWSQQDLPRQSFPGYTGHMTAPT